MWKSIEAVIEKDGKVRLKEPILLNSRCRAIVTIIESEPLANLVSETALLSEPALAEEWNLPGEDEAWSHFQKAL
jgi:hypothetical protein